MIVSAILGLIRKQCTSGGNPKSGLDRPLMPTAHCPMGSRCSASAAGGGTTEHTKKRRSRKRKKPPRGYFFSAAFDSRHGLQKSGGKAHGFNRGMKAKKLFAII